MNRQNTQEVCPWNSPKLVQATKERDYLPDWREAEDRPDVPRDLPGTKSPSLVELMRMTREEWDATTGLGDTAFTNRQARNGCGRARSTTTGS